MAFERKAATGAAPTTTKVATASSKKESNKSRSWINFQLHCETKKGTKTVSVGVSGDILFGKVFGTNWEEKINSLTEEQTELMISRISVTEFKVNLVVPDEDNEYDDVF